MDDHYRLGFAPEISLESNSVQTLQEVLQLRLETKCPKNKRREVEKKRKCHPLSYAEVLQLIINMLDKIVHSLFSLWYTFPLHMTDIVTMSNYKISLWAVWFSEPWLPMSPCRALPALPSVAATPPARLPMNEAHSAVCCGLGQSAYESAHRASFMGSTGRMCLYGFSQLECLKRFSFLPALKETAQ